MHGGQQEPGLGAGRGDCPLHEPDVIGVGGVVDAEVSLAGEHIEPMRGGIILHFVGAQRSWQSVDDDGDVDLYTLQSGSGYGIYVFCGAGNDTFGNGIASTIINLRGLD